MSPDLCDCGDQGTCPSGESCCEVQAVEACVDLSTVPQNCGSCGNSCAFAQLCDNGTCRCPTGRDLCGTDSCIDLSADLTNCGVCARVCPNGGHGTPECTSGACSIWCMTGWDNCDGNLANGCEAELSVDVANCGACGNACPTQDHFGSSCQIGVCTSTGSCESGWGDCDGDPANGCEVDLSTPQQCGACSNACATNEICDAGTCVCPPDPFAVCGAECVNTDITFSRCGSCTNSCSGGSCIGGQCVD
jgi:hypothetical protein